jgi:hypothetical protein
MHRGFCRLHLQRSQPKFDQLLLLIIAICRCLLHLNLHCQQRLLWRLLLNNFKCCTQARPVLGQ